MSPKVRFCPHCGVENGVAHDNRPPVCPRCSCRLEVEELRGHEVDLCSGCGGLWLDTDEFKVLTSERDAYLDETVPTEFKRKALVQDPGYLPCVRCGALMNKQHFYSVSGIMIDVCCYHGFWLDKGELEQMRAFVASGGIDRYQNKMIGKNSESIRKLEGEVKDLQFMQRILNFWTLKYHRFKP